MKAFGSLLISGWILMLPPCEIDANFVDRAKVWLPVAKWEVYRAYDSAHECEDARSGLLWDTAKRYAEQWGSK
jgi:hypothetical protein